MSFSNIRDIAFYGCSELYGPEISQFLQCMLQILDKLRQIFIFSYYIEEIDHFTLDLLKGPILKAGPFEEQFLIVDHPKEDHNEREFKS